MTLRQQKNARLLVNRAFYVSVARNGYYESKRLIATLQQLLCCSSALLFNIYIFSSALIQSLQFIISLQSVCLPSHFTLQAFKNLSLSNFG